MELTSNQTLNLFFNSSLTNKQHKSIATTLKKAVAPKKNSQGFQGVRGAFWIIVVCAVIAFTLFFTWFGHESHFAEGGEHPIDVWGTI